MQNEAPSSDGQESSEEAEMKRKKIEAQKVIVGREEMELIVFKIAFLISFLLSISVHTFSNRGFCLL